MVKIFSRTNATCSFPPLVSPSGSLCDCFYLIPHGCEGFNDTLEPSPAGMPLD